MSYPRVAAEEAARLMREEGYLYLDVRTEQEYAIEHVEGAFNVPYRRRQGDGMVDNPDFVAVARGALPEHAKLVVGCRSGSRSRPAAAALVAAGYVHVVEQPAGLAGSRDAFGRVVDRGWVAAGLPCASVPMAGRDYAALRDTALNPTK